ncbi:MAG: hypothetical protein AAF333_05010 [Planctomycetota bacterium]
MFNLSNIADHVRLGLAAGTLCVITLPAAAQDQPTLDELLDLVPDRSPTQDDTTDETNPDVKTPPMIDEAPTVDGVQERLSGEELADAFAQTVADMRKVAVRLDENDDPGLDTQRLQESILARLDQLIEATEQSSSSSSSSGSGSGQPSGNQDSSAQNAGQGEGQQTGLQPGQQNGAANPGGSTASDGAFSPGSVGPINPGQGAIDELRQEWGALPPRLRDELSNGLDEPYSPVYRELTEAYYRRLAEEAE